MDDNKVVLESVGAMLEALGWNVRTALNGHQAIDMLSEGIETDIVLLDYSMPDLNGFDVMRELQERGINVPVVLSSGFGEVSSTEGETLAPNAWLNKPFRSETLQQCLEGALEENGRPEQSDD